MYSQTCSSSILRVTTPAFAAHQIFEQAKFARLKVDGLAAAAHRARDEVHFEIARDELRRRRPERRTARERMQARHQLLEGEGLDEIIVAARRQGPRHGRQLPTGSSGTGPGWERLPRAAERQRTARRARAASVEDDGVESLLGSNLEACAAARGKCRLMTVRPKLRGCERPSLRNVLDDQGLHASFDSGAGASSPDPSLTPWPAIRHTARRRSQYAGRR